MPSAKLAPSISCLLLLACFPLALQASVLSQGDVVQLRRYSSGPNETFGAASGGGEFALFKRLDDDSYEFLAKTFCIEYDEHVQLDIDFLVGGVSDRAVLGGANTDTGDPIGFATDFLYAAFRRGTLETFDLGGGQFYDPTSDVWANALQRALWKLEGERSTFGSTSYADEAELLYDFALDSVSSWTENSGTVMALNLFKVGTDLTDFDPLDVTTYNTHGRDGRHMQDQLWFEASAVQSPNPVPEPSSVFVWSLLALSGAAARRRRSSQLR